MIARLTKEVTAAREGLRETHELMVPIDTFYSTGHTEASCSSKLCPSPTASGECNNISRWTSCNVNFISLKERPAEAMEVEHVSIIICATVCVNIT